MQAQHNLADILKTEKYFDAMNYPLEEILPFLKDTDAAVRATAAQTLAHKSKQDEITTALLIDLLFDPDPVVVKYAALAIGSVAPDLQSVAAKFPVLIDVLADLTKLGEDQRSAVRALSWTCSPRAARPLLDVLDNIDPDPNLFEPVQRGLVRIGNPAAEIVIKALNHEYSHVRELTAEVLGELKDNNAVEPLIQLLQSDTDSLVRQSAAAALGKISDIRAIIPLIDSLQNADESMRETVAEALGELNSEEAISTLKQMLNDPVPQVREIVQHSLSRLLDPPNK